MVANYFPARTGVVFNQFKAQGWWPSVEPPTMSKHGGHVAAGFGLSMSAAGTIYYTLDGTDPRLPEKAGRASGAQGSGVSTTAIRYTGPVMLSRSTQIKARVLSGTAWRALNEAAFAVGPVADADNLNDEDVWRTSIQTGGSPGHTGS
jgi:hypothetical protein